MRLAGPPFFPCFGARKLPTFLMFLDFPPVPVWEPPGLPQDPPRIHPRNDYVITAELAPPRPPLSPPESRVWRVKFLPQIDPEVDTNS